MRRNELKKEVERCLDYNLLSTWVNNKRSQELILKQMFTTTGFEQPRKSDNFMETFFSHNLSLEEKSEIPENSKIDTETINPGLSSNILHTVWFWVSEVCGGRQGCGSGQSTMDRIWIL